MTKTHRTRRPGATGTTTQAAVAALALFTAADEAPSRTLVVPPSNPAGSAETVLPSTGSRRLIPDADPSLDLPPHVTVNWIGAPEGVVIRGVCLCGGRHERLVGEPGAGASGEAHAARRHALLRLRDEWAGAHLECHTTSPRLLMSSVLDETFAVQHHRIRLALAEGRPIPECMGITYRDKAEHVTVLSPLDDLRGLSTQAYAAALAARHFELREAVRRGGQEPQGGFGIVIRDRTDWRNHLPDGGLRATSSRFERPWALHLIVTTRSLGLVCVADWCAPGLMPRSYPPFEFLEAGFPMDVVDGLLARSTAS